MTDVTNTDLDARVGVMFQEVLRQVHLGAPEELAGILAEEVRRIGVDWLTVYVVDYEQQGPNPAIEQGKTHHAAVVTAVMPDGEIKYTQHSDSYQNVSIQGRLPHETESEGLQNLRFVRPEPDWY